MKWEKKAPNQVGYWIRLNVIHEPELSYIYEDYRNPDKALCVMWGWSTEGKQHTRIEDILYKVEHFWWTGPLTNMPKRDKLIRRGDKKR